MNVPWLKETMRDLAIDWVRYVYDYNAEDDDENDEDDNNNWRISGQRNRNEDINKNTSE